MKELDIHFQELARILDSLGERVEGNFVCDIEASYDTRDRNAQKIKNLQQLVAEKKRICEIGINAGHSLLLMLEIMPTAHYLLFDLNLHRYTEPCLAYVRSQFPKATFTVVFGDSKDTVPKYIQEHTSECGTYDVIHIDGGHLIKDVKSDYRWTQHLASPTGSFVFDDYDMPEIRNFLDERLANGEIIRLPLPHQTSQHIVYQKCVNRVSL